MLTSDISGRGYPQYNSIAAGLALVATVALDIVLIPSMGIIGAALASTISYSMTFVLSVVFYLLVAKTPAAGGSGPAGPGARTEALG